ncbi:FGGY-family carbohydrate kinase [Comamonas composti]|uniref:FGGY-family carbohydrate kinase n=1 Tax=Comamonas composti TaxID=408558 RepID=UPI00042A8FA8|nr:FGGY-family carbohydrate kinase [Comamonas composti]
MSLYIGIDIGTSGVRALAIDSEGKPAGEAAQELPAPERQGLAVWQEAECWWQATRQVLTRLLCGLDPGRVESLAFNGTSGTLLLTAADGQPLAPALMYNDARAVEAMKAIEHVAPANSAARGTGSSLARLLHLQRHHPRARHALHQADWLAGRMSGHWGFSDHNNALKLGYDPQALCWPDWLSKLGVDERLLPQVTAPGTALHTIDLRIAHEFGLRPDVRIVAGTTDGVAAFMATGAREIGDAVTSLGSTLVLKVVSDTGTWAAEYGVYSHRFEGRWLAGGASNSGGAVLLQFFDQATMRALTPRLRPDHPTGLGYYPLPHRGERFPSNNPAQLSRTLPRPKDDALFFQALLEGIASIEHDGYRRLQALGAPYPKRIRTAGGGAVNAAWTEIRRRCLGTEMVASAHTAAAYGTALLALRGAASSPAQPKPQTLDP